MVHVQNYPCTLRSDHSAPLYSVQHLSSPAVHMRVWNIHDIYMHIQLEEIAWVPLLVCHQRTELDCEQFSEIAFMRVCFKFLQYLFPQSSRKMLFYMLLYMCTLVYILILNLEEWAEWLNIIFLNIVSDGLNMLQRLLSKYLYLELYHTWLLLFLHSA